MAIKEKIGKRLREIRFSKGLTQKTMAQMAGVDYTYIGKIERAEQLPSLGVLIKISEALSLPLDRFIMDESTLRLINLLPGEGYRVVRKKEIWDLLKALEDIHEEDIPLLIEIVSVLKKHREKRERLPMVAEPPEAYRKRKK
ncbi:MAG: helix-turn-helix transcriptional regulator [Deltaproteobacteria bacterium]|nr:helix-turn-helix transcriptional regulator [Deltaproteobacteria bacterium]